jgi:hypothetical protein
MDYFGHIFRAFFVQHSSIWSLGLDHALEWNCFLFLKPHGITLALEIIRPGMKETTKNQFCANVSRLFYL